MSEPPLHTPCPGVGVCPGCGALLPVEDGPTHPYMRSSPSCWARYGEVLAREFGDPRYFAVHQLTVDAYAAQHPGVAERRAIQSVGLHLMTLCMVIEDGVDPREGPKLHCYNRRIEGPPDRAAAAASDLASVGGSDAAVEIVDYDPTWPERFAAERERLEPLLPGAEIHNVVADRSELARHLRFRDRLREDPGMRTEYADLKRRIAARFSDDREAYTNAKTEFVRRVEAG